MFSFLAIKKSTHVLGVATIVEEQTKYWIRVESGISTIYPNGERSPQIGRAGSVASEAAPEVKTVKASLLALASFLAYAAWTALVGGGGEALTANLFMLATVAVLV